MRRTESEIFAVIKPSNSYETCQLIISRYGKAERAARSWNPTADDLTADDWNYSGDELCNKVCNVEKSFFSLIFHCYNCVVRKLTIVNGI